MHVVACRFELRFPQCHSLKAKRSVLRPLIEGGRHRFGVSWAEVDHQNTWQRSDIGVAVVSDSATKAAEVMDDVERFVWSFPDIEVLGSVRSWLEELD
jgi:uncharacterized protein YlxP (DUF503 family)